MNREFWNGRRVLLTGHTGFKGTWLALWLARLGARVTGFSLPAPPPPGLYLAARAGEGVESLTGDLRDPEQVAEAVGRCDPEVVLHLAAQSLVHAGYRDPLATYATNVLGTAHLLEALRGREAVRAVVSVTSDKCYENVERPEPYREADRLGGRDPYSSSKACAELVTAAYRRSFFADDGAAAVATARSGNVIGGGDWAADRLVPDLVRGFLAGRPVAIRRPDAVRPWQHVLEPLAGYLLLAERLAVEGAPFAGAWNFGPAEGDACPVERVADRMAELWGEGAGWVRDAEAHPPEATLLTLESSQARDRLGWRPRLDLETALAWTVEGYRAFARGEDPRAPCERQIAAYEKLVAGGGEG